MKKGIILRVQPKQGHRVALNCCLSCVFFGGVVSYRPSGFFRVSPTFENLGSFRP